MTGFNLPGGVPDALGFATFVEDGAGVQVRSVVAYAMGGAWTNNTRESLGV